MQNEQERYNDVVSLYCGLFLPSLCEYRLVVRKVVSKVDFYYLFNVEIEIIRGLIDKLF
jgi:hypothetical protein